MGSSTGSPLESRQGAGPAPREVGSTLRRRGRRALRLWDLTGEGKEAGLE